MVSTTVKNTPSLDKPRQESPHVVPTVSNPPTGPPSKILFLDGVRGLAAILVVCQHSREYLHDLDLGACAVDIFFVLSSFLLTMLFTTKSLQFQSQNASWRTWALYFVDYGAKRFLRVYPLFVVVVGLLWCLPPDLQQRYYLVKNPADFDVVQVLTFRFPHRYFVFWTLPLEIAYYFCLPVLVLAILTFRRFWWLPVVPLYTWILYAGWYERRSSHSPLLPHLPTFVAGSLAAILYIKIDRWCKTTRYEISTFQKSLIRGIEYTAVLFILSLCFRRNAPPGHAAEPTMFLHWVPQHKTETSGGFPFLSVPVTLVLVIELLWPSAIAAVFEWNLLRYWGKISFSVYLLHSFVLFSDIYTKDTVTMYYERLFLRFGLIAALSTTSYYLIEYPSQRLAQRVTRRLREHEATPATQFLPFSYDSKRQLFTQTTRSA